KLVRRSKPKTKSEIRLNFFNSGILPSSKKVSEMTNNVSCPIYMVLFGSYKEKQENRQHSFFS
ncbi:MAG: hypothetical protein KJN84_02650, partial [Bacteroidia bacterium]|nr:hypothetical protein [Bacteroidia bacterium]